MRYPRTPSTERHDRIHRCVYASTAISTASPRGSTSAAARIHTELMSKYDEAVDANSRRRTSTCRDASMYATLMAASSPNRRRSLAVIVLRTNAVKLSSAAAATTVTTSTRTRAEVCHSAHDRGVVTQLSFFGVRCLATLFPRTPPTDRTETSGRNLGMSAPVRSQLWKSVPPGQITRVTCRYDDQEVKSP